MLTKICRLSDRETYVADMYGLPNAFNAFTTKGKEMYLMLVTYNDKAGERLASCLSTVELDKGAQFRYLGQVDYCRDKDFFQLITEKRVTFFRRFRMKLQHEKAAQLVDTDTGDLISLVSTGLLLKSLKGNYEQRT